MYISNRFLVCRSRRGAQGRLDKNYPPWWVSADGMHKGIEEANFPGGRARLRRSFSIIIGSMNGRGEWYSCASYTRYPCTCTLQHVTLKLRVDVPLSPLPSSEFDSWMRLVISSGPAQRMGEQSLFTHVHRLSKRGWYATRVISDGDTKRGNRSR